MAVKRNGYTTAVPGTGMASVDGLLEYAGVAHPAVSTHMLATLGVLLISIGTLNISPLLPIPLYGCWGGITGDHVPNSQSCQGYKLLPSDPVNTKHYVWQCGAGSSWWSPFSWMAGVLVFVRIACTIVTGLCLDIHGRKRVAIVTMAVYFMFAFARSFAPIVEVSIIAIVIEAAAAEAVIVGLLLISLENSIQKECVRSVCLVMLGHSLAVAAVAAPIDSLTSGQMWPQLAKSLPSAACVVLLCWLPNSVRWVLGGGDWVDAVFLFPKTHNIQLDETMKPKLVAVQRQTQQCLSRANCLGSCVHRCVCPLFKTRLLKVWFIGSLCAFIYGITVGTLLIADQSPYASVADRSLAFGCTEFTVLVIVALIMGRLGARPLLATSMVALGAAAALSTLTSMVNVDACLLDVILSLTSHGCAVGAGVSIVVAMWRLCPTHSRGAMYGFVWAWAVLGFAVAGPYCDALDGLHVEHILYELKLYTCAGGCLIAGVISLFLPRTPTVLPDTLSHLTRKNYYHSSDWDNPSYPDRGSQVDNTRF